MKSDVNPSILDLELFVRRAHPPSLFDVAVPCTDVLVPWKDSECKTDLSLKNQIRDLGL